MTRMAIVLLSALISSSVGCSIQLKRGGFPVADPHFGGGTGPIEHEAVEMGDEQRFHSSSFRHSLSKAHGMGENFRRLRSLLLLRTNPAASVESIAHQRLDDGLATDIQSLGFSV